MQLCSASESLLMVFICTVTTKRLLLCVSKCLQVALVYTMLASSNSGINIPFNSDTIRHLKAIKRPVDSNSLSKKSSGNGEILKLKMIFFIVSSSAFHYLVNDLI